jgi:hypothetical protein
LLRVSELDNDWKETIKNKNQPKEYFLKFDK